MKKRHKDEYSAVGSKLDKDQKEQEQQLVDKYEKEKDKTLREKKNKHAAELAARKDLSQDEATAVSRTPISCILSYFASLRIRLKLCMFTVNGCT